MTGSNDQHDPEPAVRERALDWHVRLASDEASEADWARFETWLGEAPEHLSAYEAVEALWRDLDEVAHASSNVRRLNPRRQPPVWLGAIAASLVVAVALGVTLRTLTPKATIYETAKGERRSIILADGSRIQMNSGSHIEVTLARSVRRVEMANAEAVFDVAKDAHRPFLITAGDRQIRVVGTEFNVLRHGGQVNVTVRRGVVEVRSTAALQGPALVQLGRGQSLRHREGAPTDIVDSDEQGTAFAWTAGQAVYQDRPITDVAADLNRYMKTPIVVAPEARGLRLTAVINVDDEAAVLRTLSQFLPVSAVHQAGQIQLRLRPKGR